MSKSKKTIIGLIVEDKVLNEFDKVLEVLKAKSHFGKRANRLSLIEEYMREFAVL